MKKIIQIILILLILISIIVFKNLYFIDNKNNTVSELKIPEDKIVQLTNNDVIKNLEYQINIDEDNRYIISSEITELIESNDNEILQMTKVKAIILDKDNKPITIKSDNAIYNNRNHNTIFRKNVSIQYMENKIYSDKLDLNFKDKIVRIFDNVNYIGKNGLIYSDNIMINLITKKVDIYMHYKIDNVRIIHN